MVIFFEKFPVVKKMLPWISKVTPVCVWHMIAYSCCDRVWSWITIPGFHVLYVRFTLSSWAKASILKMVGNKQNDKMLGNWIYKKAYC